VQHVAIIGSLYTSGYATDASDHEGYIPPWRRQPPCPSALRLSMSLPTGIATINEAELRYGKKLGAGGFADVYCATWVTGLLEEGGRDTAEQREQRDAGDEASEQLPSRDGEVSTSRASSTDEEAPDTAMAASCVGMSTETSVAGGSSLAPRRARRLAVQRAARPSKLFVAVKRLHSAPEDAPLMAAFCHEIGLMKRLDHPNVLALYGVTVSPDGSLGIVTELAPRASLFHFLHPGGVITGDPPAVPLAWRFLQGAAAGMVRMR